MTHKQPAWSYSALTKFETCPKQYYHVKVAKDVAEQPTDATIWGERVHKHLEDRVKHGTPLPDMLRSYEKFIQPIADKPGIKLVEQQLAINAALQPTDWFAKDAWCRGIVDVGVLSGSKGVLLDYKTGKRKPESSQLKLFAALAFAHYESLRVVHTGFVWLKDSKLDSETFTREGVALIWQEFLPRVQRLERAYKEDKFPPKPSGLCRSWCPVPRSKCEFSGRNG